MIYDDVYIIIGTWYSLDILLDDKIILLVTNLYTLNIRLKFIYTDNYVWYLMYVNHIPMRFLKHVQIVYVLMTVQ